MTASRDVRVAIVGSGFGGLGTAIRLRREGIDDFVLLERADDVGGTWRDNSYPGCACDVQSHLYSFSFALNPDWTRTFSRQPEIWEYLQRVAREHGVLPHIRFGHDVQGATWDEAAQRWRIATTRGEFTARYLVAAAGALSDPKIPELPGLASFAGHTFHSARWDHDYDLAGRRVAVVGTGASVIQFVPEIQPAVAQLDLYQRTPAWVIPRHERAISRGERWIYRHLPFTQRAVRGRIYLQRELFMLGFRHPAVMRLVSRVALHHMHRAVTDPALRAKLTPDYALGCKRVLISNDYFPALTRPNVDVVTTGIAEVRPHSIVDAAGVERPADAIIFGTGFHATDPPLAPHVRGRGGRTLADAWQGSPKAYAGTTVAGFPNFFMLPGPGTGLGHTSVVYMLEAQIDHVVGVMRLVERGGAAAAEPREDAQAAWVARLDAHMRGTVWVDGGCRSWYLDRTGRNSTLWPDFTWRYRRRVERANSGAYLLHAPRVAGVRSRPSGPA